MAHAGDMPHPINCFCGTPVSADSELPYCSAKCSLQDTELGLANPSNWYRQTNWARRNTVRRARSLALKGEVAWKESVASDTPPPFRGVHIYDVQDGGVCRLPCSAPSWTEGSESSGLSESGPLTSAASCALHPRVWRNMPEYPTAFVDLPPCDSESLFDETARDLKDMRSVDFDCRSWVTQDWRDAPSRFDNGSTEDLPSANVWHTTPRHLAFHQRTGSLRQGAQNGMVKLRRSISIITERLRQPVSEVSRSARPHPTERPLDRISGNLLHRTRHSTKLGSWRKVRPSVNASGTQPLRICKRMPASGPEAGPPSLRHSMSLGLVRPPSSAPAVEIELYEMKKCFDLINAA